MTQRNTALAPISQRQVAAFEPGNLSEAYKMAEMLAKSGIIPRAYQGQPADILVSVMIGRELGFPPMQSLRGIHVVNGLVIMSADLIVGKVLSHPKCLYFKLVESTATSATYETHREGDPEPTTLTWGYEDAERAGLLGKDNYQKYGKTMYRHRCAAALARAVYPDALFGVYVPEEEAEIREDLGTIVGKLTESKAAALRARLESERSRAGDDSEPGEAEEPSDDDPATDQDIAAIRQLIGVAELEENQHDEIEHQIEEGLTRGQAQALRTKIREQVPENAQLPY